MALMFRKPVSWWVWLCSCCWFGVVCLIGLAPLIGAALAWLTIAD